MISKRLAFSKNDFYDKDEISYDSTLSFFNDIIVD
jgi:hypothetical protein